jgi:hypothetical protein
MSRPVLKLKTPRKPRRQRVPIDKMAILRAEEKKRLALMQAEMDQIAGRFAR